MGCICSKGITDVTHVRREKASKKASKRLVASSRREEVVVDADNGGNEATTRLILPELVLDNVGSSIAWDERDKNCEKPQNQNQATIEPPVVNVGQPRNQISRVFSVTNGVDRAQVAAGWPSWLTAVAGEAIKGWVPRKADSFQKLDKIGQGTYSSVYRARDNETGKIVALKKVRFVNMDPESVRFMAREILVLRRLDHPNVMKLEGLVTSRMSGNIYLVFEYMEHDLAGLIASPHIKFTEPQIKCYMKQLFLGLEHCHSRGVLHRDVKGSNLLIDDNGNLKIGDFGLATFYRNNKQPLTSRVVTLWYRPPELLLGATDYGVAVDLWSSGCILAELYSGKPIMPGRTEVEQLHKIFKLCGSPSDEYWQKSKLPHATVFKPQHPYKCCVAETFKDFPSPALALLHSLLAIEPENRGSASSALQSEFFSTKPLPCDPSSLPKYPPSKEFDAKLRDDEAKRLKEAANGIGHAHESHRKLSRSRAVPAPDANAELPAAILKRKGLLNPKSNSEQFNPEEDGGTGFRMEPSSSGTLECEAKMGSQLQLSSSKNDPVTAQKSFRPQWGPLSRFSNSVAVRGSSRFDMSRETTEKWPEEQICSKYNHLNHAESSVSHDLSRHLLDGSVSYGNKGENMVGKEPKMVHPAAKHRIHHSGPLLPQGGNIEEMLKEHEKRIQHAVRKARIDKAKSKEKYRDNGQTEFLLPYRINGR